MNEINDIVQSIIRYKRSYYSGKPEVSDAVYDKLEDKLRNLSPNHPALNFIGTDQLSANKKVSHKIPMLSLQKTYEVDDLKSWAGSHNIMATLKVDGNSLSLVYEEGDFTLAKTRGNGKIGENVTEKVRWVLDVPNKIEGSLSYEVRGELYCKESQFLKLVGEFEKLGLDKPTNPRNIVAGLLGRKQYYELARYFNFFAFDVLDAKGESPFNTELQKVEWLKKQGFSVPNPKVIPPSDLEGYLTEVKDIMEQGEIGLDGAVFSYNEVSLHSELGNTSHHPRFKMSFKWQGETAESVITKISWATSRFGVVTPVAVIEPIYLSGATITNVTLHNAEHVRSFNLKAGDVIEIVRSGEVIPKFLEVKKAAKGIYQWPEKCPECEGALVFDDVRLKCENSSGCSAQLSGRILNWIKSVGIDDLSEKRLFSMMEIGLVASIEDLYKLKLDDLLKLPLTKEKMARKLFDNIQKSKNLTPVKLLTGFGISGMGESSWEKLLSEFGSVEKLFDLSAEDIVSVEGFAEKTALQVFDGLREVKGFYENIKSLGVMVEEIDNIGPIEGVLSGKVFVITGTLSQPRKQIEANIKSNGGKTSSSVSQNTFALICNDKSSSSSKMKKAQELNVKVLSEVELQEMTGVKK